MLLHRLQVFFLVLLLVTVGHHLLKDSIVWASAPPVPVLPYIDSPLHTSYTNDPTILYAFNQITPVTAVRTGYYRPLQKFVYRRRGHLSH
jgi:hypothetical protein